MAPHAQSRATRRSEGATATGIVFAMPHATLAAANAQSHSRGHSVQRAPAPMRVAHLRVGDAWRASASARHAGEEICPRGCSTPHGVCTNGVCVCGASWQGDACERSTCPGSPEPCSAHGECVEGRCECHAGWKGAECALNRTSTEALLECSREHCNGETHGRCSGGDVGSCICLSGWVGADCGESLCPDSCSGNGFCTDFGCSCYAGFSGNSCEVAECPKQCSGRGECQRGRCRCMFGWMGEDCSQQLSEYRQQTAPRIPV